jgi:hypothetical protein
MRWRLPEIPVREKSVCSQGIFITNEARAIVIERSGKVNILKIEHSRPTEPAI